MGATVENSSGFGIIGKPEQLKRITRKIRPYRHAYIKITKPSGGPISWSYIKGINEFGEGLVTGVGDGHGDYTLNLNPSCFHNLDNVIQESDIIHTTASRPVLTSIFSDDTKSVVSYYVYDVTIASNIDIEGEILVIIREFYE